MNLKLSGQGLSQSGGKVGNHPAGCPPTPGCQMEVIQLDLVLLRLLLR